jgi:hypothetical protein
MAARDPEPPVGFRRTYVDGLPGINSVCGRAGLYFCHLQRSLSRGELHGCIVLACYRPGLRNKFAMLHRMTLSSNHYGVSLFVETDAGEQFPIDPLLAHE